MPIPAIHNIRVIARLDIKGERLIKSIQLEGVRVVGEPQAAAQRYYEQGADEILLMDAVASLYGRNHLFELIRRVSQNVFLPITVGGGIRKLDDVDAMLRAGADKVAINTAAVAGVGPDHRDLEALRLPVHGGADRRQASAERRLRGLRGQRARAHRVECGRLGP